MNVPLIVLTTGAVLILLEQFADGRSWPRTPWWLARAGLFNAAQAGVAYLGARTWDLLLPHLAPWSLAELGLLPGALTGYLLITFVYYWWHRWRHSSPGLWRWLHQLHHSPQRLEVLTSFYKHPFELLLNGVLSSFILYVALGLSAAQATLAVLFTGLAELFYHANIRTPRWVGWFIQRPEMHCVHHQRDRHASNYSDLPLWDRLFGTYENPATYDGDCGFADQRELLILSMLAGRDVTRVRGDYR